MDDERNYDGIPKAKRPDLRFDRMEGSWVECPKCEGHGKWIYKPPYTPHMHCGQCNGWGWVRQGSTDETCAHEWKHEKLAMRCMYKQTCTKCGHSRTYSTDD